MTAINEQGQVYWTFEELDLDGAYEEVGNEFTTISKNMDVVKSLYDDALLMCSHDYDNPTVVFIWSKWTAMHDKMHKLHKVLSLISALIKEGK
jgi:hypothetical protein